MSEPKVKLTMGVLITFRDIHMMAHGGKAPNKLRVNPLDIEHLPLEGSATILGMHVIPDAAMKRYSIEASRVEGVTI